MNNSLSAQTLAALINAPASLAVKALERLEEYDFPEWAYRTIFSELSSLTFPPVPQPGSIVVQLNAALLEGGHFQDQDNGLRQIVLDLTTSPGHPEQLSHFCTLLIEQRFRTAVVDFAAGVAGHAQDSPLSDVDASLRQIEKLRDLRRRINDCQITTRPLRAVEGVA